MKNKAINVVFLLEDGSDTDVYAFFPEEPHDLKGNKTSYSHVGQHSACSPAYAIICKEAEPEQYKGLQTELESIGYKLNILN